MNKPIPTKLVWMDLEMTGLDFKKDKIIQAAVLVTDTELNILDNNGYVEYVKISQAEIDNMSNLVKDMHTKNGVLEKCLKSEKDIEEIDSEVVEYLKQFTVKQESPLCGNSVWVDRIFITNEMPLTSEFLHYRNIDVTTLKLLNSIWNIKEYIKPSGNDEALDDIRQSIDELRFYKQEILVKH
jgi:oligoribonuclease